MLAAQIELLQSSRTWRTADGRFQSFCTAEWPSATAAKR